MVTKMHCKYNNVNTKMHIADSVITTTTIGFSVWKAEPAGLCVNRDNASPSPPLANKIRDSLVPIATYDYDAPRPRVPGLDITRVISVRTSCRKRTRLSARVLRGKNNWSESIFV